MIEKTDTSSMEFYYSPLSENAHVLTTTTTSTITTTTTT